MLNLEEDCDSSAADSSKNKETPSFKITSTHIATCKEFYKKYVAYMLQICLRTTTADASPAILERRYTDFRNLYRELNKECSKYIRPITFPKRVFFGNFDIKIILSRRAGFESLLKHILAIPRLRNSKAFLKFLQKNELNKAEQYLNEKQYALVLPLLENNYRILNMIYPDHSNVVLLALYRILGCCIMTSVLLNTEKCIDLAFQHFEDISDGEMLALFLPLLHLCTDI